MSDGRIAELHDHRGNNCSLPNLGPDVVNTPRKVGKMLSSRNGCSKRARVVQLEDTMISAGVDDVKDINDKLGCSSTKCNFPDKTQMVRQKNSFSSKRGDRRNFKVPVKPKFDSFSKKAGLASFTMASGGNNFLGFYGLKSDGIHDVTELVEDLSLNELLDGIHEYPILGREKGRKAANTTENFLHSVKKVCSILPLGSVQSQNFTDIDSSSHKKMPMYPLSSVSDVTSCINGDKEDTCSVDPSPCNKDSCGKPEMPACPSDFPLCQPKDILERLALPPPKDLDSLLLDATKPSSSARNNSDTRSGKQIFRRASLPPFPWSHTINGCRTNPDAVKLLSNKSTCQGRWVKIPYTSSSPGIATGCFTNLESLAFDSNLIPSLSKFCNSEGGIASSTVNLRFCEQSASPLASYSKAFNAPQVGHCPRILAAARTLCDIATKPLRQNPDGITRWPKRPSQKAMKARKTKSIEKPEEIYVTPSSVSGSDKPLRSDMDQIIPMDRFGNVYLEDEPCETMAKNSSSMTQTSYAEMTTKYLIERKKWEEGNKELDLAQYESLWKAIIREDWKEVKKHLLGNHALTTPITAFYETILHILVNSKKAFRLIDEIVKKIDADSLEKTNYQNDTALSVAAYVGNTEAAELMARKNPKLLTRLNYSYDSPFHAAARFGHEETIRSLLSVAQATKEIDDQSFFYSDDNGFTIVQYLISANLYGVALDMLKLYPDIGRKDLKHRKTILEQLAGKPLGFESGHVFGPWERFIYKGISLEKEVTTPFQAVDDDDSLSIKIDGEITKGSINLLEQCRRQAFSIFCLIFPKVEHIYKTKLMNEQARALVKSMCGGVIWTFDNALDVLKLPVLKAASLGIREIVEEILKVYPTSTMFYDDDNYNIFQLAILNRREKVFELIHETGLSQKWATIYSCKNNENILHLAAACKPSRQLEGAALQMQREIQWFTAAEKLVHPSLLEQRNNKNQTPREVFAETHKDLVKEGEKWMRDTATSCMVVDTLIISIAFAAIIAVPGNNDEGIPYFHHETLFKIFVVADTAALFSSSFSLLLFVRILTSRYEEEDFLKALPRKLLLGLMTLILSVATMLISSSSALIMLVDAVPGPKVMLRWSTIVPVTIMAALPVVYFICSQFHLIMCMFLSTL